MRKFLIILVAVIVLAAVGGLVYKYKFAGGYDWYDNSETKYKNLTWQAGDISPLAGIPAKYEAKEMRAEKCVGLEEAETNDHLRVEGGMCALPVKLFIKDENGQAKNLGGRAELLKLLGKIDTPEKAVSLVVLTTSDIKRTAESLVVSRNTKVASGFLVEYISNNTFGCGTHQPLKQIVSVSENGEIKLVASEKEKPSLEPEMCVD